MAPNPPPALPPGLPGAQAPGPPLLLLGVDHLGTPLALRERLTYSASDAETVLVRLLACPEIAEAALLSTCNRTEVLLLARDEDGAYRSALELVFAARAPEVVDRGHVRVHRGGAAARHCLAVAAGLRSMVFGEPEVLGQVRQTAAAADAIGASGTIVRRLLRAAAAAGARARAETAIGAGAVSLGYASVELAENIFTRVQECSALLLGTGTTATLVAQSLTERGIGRLTIAHRGGSDSAARLFERFPAARPLAFADLAEALPHADLVVAAIATEEPVLTHAGLAAATARRDRPLLIVDLGVPRNVEPEAGRLGNVFLHDLDSLGALIERNLRRRREEAPAVEAILDAELQRFLHWYRGLEAEPLVAELQRRAERVRRDELERARAEFPAHTHERLDRLTRALVTRILHHPSARLRADDAAPAHLELVRELFRLDEE